MLVTAIAGLNDNYFQGISSLLMGKFLIIISHYRNIIAERSLSFFSVFTLVLLVELLLLGFPDQIVSNLSNEILGDRRSFWLVVLNLSSPIVYIVIKIAIAGTLFYVHVKQKQYMAAKASFESVLFNG